MNEAERQPGTPSSSLAPIPGQHRKHPTPPLGPRISDFGFLPARRAGAAFTQLSTLNPQPVPRQPADSLAMRPTTRTPQFLLSAFRFSVLSGCNVVGVVVFILVPVPSPSGFGLRISDFPTSGGPLAAPWRVRSSWSRGSLPASPNPARRPNPQPSTLNPQPPQWRRKPSPPAARPGILFAREQNQPQTAHPRCKPHACTPRACAPLAPSFGLLLSFLSLIHI